MQEFRFPPPKIARVGSRPCCDGCQRGTGCTGHVGPTSGVHDVPVGACKELHTIDDLPGTFLFARSAQ